MKKLYPSLLGLLGGLVMAACEPAEPDVATLRINLIDAPGDYESVNIDIADVQVKMEGDAGEWLSLDEVNTGVFNVLELTNGHSALLGEVDLPPGTLQQVRLVLGQNHDLSIGGEVKALPFASGSTGVIELDVVGDLSANRVFELVLDFDAGRSVVASESGETFRLRPVVRVILDPDNGSIMGRIDPGAVSTAVFALIGADTITSTYTG
ncbi:MAG TPA: hypothetical protein DCR93_28565, partial [Cytophagales bacterium]|nr:hypothetical protein [Cytophagales bacterium]